MFKKYLPLKNTASIIIASTLFFIVCSAFANENLISPELGSCRLKERLDNQEHYECLLGSSKKAIQILKLSGSEEHTAYYHGLFLKNEIESGLLLGIRTELGRSLATLEPLQRQKFESLSKCILSHMEDSTSEDFKNTLKRFHRGLRAAGSKVTYEEILQANLMVDLSIYFETLERQLSLNPAATQRSLALSCGPHLVGQQLSKTLNKLGKTFKRFKMGCTGVSAGGDMTLDKTMILGRNFDTGLLGFFEKHPTVLLKNLPNGTKTVGIASAGLHYAGGISGFNNHGLVASLHQLQTDDTGMNYKNGTADTTPYLLQKVLNQAKNIDEAFAIISKTEAFGAWTVFIGDSKNQELASIEISGKHKVIARRKKQNLFLAQSNHYIAPVMQAAGYEYSLNKSLESRARFELVNRRLQESTGSINPQWVINMLSGHTDNLVNGPRSFGRTTTKVYTAATHVMIPEQSEFWMTIGETYPTNQGHFYNFKINFDSFSFQIAERTLAEREYNLPNWYASQKHYVLAYLHHEDNYRSLPQTQRVIDDLTSAVELAKKDQIEELPYYYIRARIEIYKSILLLNKSQNLVAANSLKNAINDLTWILKNSDTNNTLSQMKVLQYEKALAHLWLGRAETLLSRIENTGMLPNSSIHSKKAQEILKELTLKNPRHQGLLKVYQSSLKSLSGEEILDTSIAFGTVE